MNSLNSHYKDIGAHYKHTFFLYDVPKRQGHNVSVGSLKQEAEPDV